MSEWGREAMEAWARERGLAFEGEGLFPAATHLLREGLGAGTHRAGVIVSEETNSITSVGGLSKKPERHTMNIVRGRLPGGLDGAVGHHFHLEYRTTGESDSWLAKPHTVVFAYVPEGARACRELAVRGGIVSTDPHEPGDPFEHLAGEVDVNATVEMRDGYLCVALPGVIEDAAALDELCRMAATVAEAARAVAAQYPPLDPTAPTRAQVLPPELQWAETMSYNIQWSEPPASVPAAMDAYAGLYQGGAPDTGRQVTRLILIVLIVVGLAGFGIAAGLVFVLNMPIEGLALAAACVIAAPRAIRAALQTGRETDQTATEDHSRLPGLEAFAREYARSRGMALEDRDEFRRRFASPIPGAPLKVMYGRLGGDVTGRIVLWIARDERFAVQYWNMAVVPAPAGDAAGVLPGFRVERVGDLLVVAEPVPDEGRSVERLDALRVTAVRAAGGVPELQAS